MAKLGKFGKLGETVKEFLGMEHDNIEDEFNDELVEELDLPPKKEVVKKKVVKENLAIEKEFENKKETSKSSAQEEEEDANCSTIFMDPKSFADSKKIANYIKNEKMVTLNLENLEPGQAQRMLDFLMGAMLVKGAALIQISKKVYTSVPKTMKVHYEGKKDLNTRVSVEIDEE